MSQTLSEASSRLTDLLDLQQPPLARFASETFLAQIGEANPWFEHSDPLSFSFTPHSQQPNTAADLANIYTQAHTLIGQALKTAQAAGNTLHIAVGETHDNRKSLACVYALMSAALDHGITLFTDEKEQEYIDGEALMIADFYQQRGEIPEQLKPTGQPLQTTYNTFFWHQHPEFKRFNVIPIDTNLTEARATTRQGSPEYNALRESAMVKELARLMANSIGVIGSNHFKAIIEGLTPHPVTVLALDVSHEITIRNREALNNPTPDEAREIECQAFTLTSEKVMNLALPGMGIHTAAEARDLAEAGIAMAAPTRMHPGAFSAAIAQASEASSHHQIF